MSETRWDLGRRCERSPEGVLRGWYVQLYGKFVPIRVAAPYEERVAGERADSLGVCMGSTGIDC